MQQTYTVSRDDILAWLREEDPTRLEELWRMADETRKANVGDAVHLRGLIEVSSYCSRQCGYCGLRSSNQSIDRYRMSADEILECARQAVEFGYGTVVMQSGEDWGITCAWMADVVRRIKAETPLAVTLSLGERTDEELATWKEAGADRYLLRFETSDPELYRLIHPTPADRPRQDRIGILRVLRELGYEVGSGVMVGIPGQTYDTLANDIDTFRALDLDMIGVGPYISHPATPLGSGAWHREIPPEEQVPNTESMTYKVVALTRLVAPEANIPSTTALATLNRAQGRETGLRRGANVVMPNLTPVKYREMYEIYPAKVCINETSNECRFCMQVRIQSIGRALGTGQGGRVRGDVRGAESPEGPNGQGGA